MGLSLTQREAVSLLRKLEAYSENQRACIDYLRGLGIAGIEIPSRLPERSVLPQLRRDYDYFTDLEIQIRDLRRRSADR